MEWIVKNWSLLVVILAFGLAGFTWAKKFASLPSEQQLLKVKEWLLWAVVLAEKELGSGTGQLKLRYVYDLFLEDSRAWLRLYLLNCFHSMLMKL